MRHAARSCGAIAIALGWMVWCAPAMAGHVQTEMFASTSGVQAGVPFWVGLRLTIDPGWHVYWKNAGEAGLPTKVEFVLPDGFSAGPLEYPTPSRFVAPGNITMFGYEKSVMFLTKITPAATLPTGFSGLFKANVHWLVCADQCILGKASVQIPLAVSGSASAMNEDLFKDWQAQIPVDAKACPEVSQVETGKNQIQVIWTHAAPQDADFFPEALDDYNINAIDVSETQDTTTITFTPQVLAGRHPGNLTLNGVLGYTDRDGNRRGIDLSVALPAP